MIHSKEGQNETKILRKGDERRKKDYVNHEKKKIKLFIEVSSS